MKDELKLIGSWCIAIVRLLLVCFILFVEGLHHILFSRNEVCGVVLRVVPIRSDRDKLTFVENLAMNNLDLMAYQNEDEGMEYTDDGSDGDLGE